MTVPFSFRCSLSSLAVLCLSTAALAEPPSWTRSYHAGYFDTKGAYAGGSEIMHLTAHKGKLYAANGYWVDARWEIPPEGQKQSAQVLRLDAPEGQWQVDLEMGKENPRGLQYMKGNILKSVTFTRDANGKTLPDPQTLLVMAAGANFERGGAVSAWIRDDATGSWTHTLVRHGSSNGGVRWVPRDMEIYRDKVTGVEHLLMSLGNPGIVSAVYDSNVPGNIRWNRHLEYPFLNEGSFKTRPLGMTQANGSLFFSEGDSIYQRIDGEEPTYTEILDLFEDTDTDVGGIRGLTSVKNPNGPGHSLLFLWAPGGRSKSQVVRLDPDGAGHYRRHDEVAIMDLMSKELGVEVTYTLGAHNMMYPIVDPTNGETAHLIGFLGNIRGNDKLRWPGTVLYAGAMYAIRRSDQRYSLHEVNNRWKPGKQVLVTPRTFCLSPFDEGDLYVAGHDSSRKLSDDMAWIFRAPLKVVLGKTKASDAPAAPAKRKPSPRLRHGLIYELRIYTANEHRHGYLIKRFREHTDRIFRKHGLEAIGYWLPTEGPPKKKRRFVYILKHPSRYAAYQNWIHFRTDREWEKVLDQPEFQGLLTEKPTSIFMTPNNYSKAERVPKTGGIFELRTYLAAPGKLKALNARFRDHTTKLLTKHGMTKLGSWTPFDQPKSENTLISLLHHPSREQAEQNWQSFQADPAWKKIVRESEVDGKLLAQPPERLFLKGTDFSSLK